jgi:prepilin-type N-terminal cleavage/methylation domain-containing protein
MTLSQTRKVARGGFTLIELLVVIAIIAVLFSLTAVAVMRVLGKGPEVMNRSDISQLATSLGEFNSKFGAYPPSRMLLRPNASAYNTIPANTTQAEIDRARLEADSKAFLLKMFPRLMDGPWGAANGGIDWNGDGTVNAAGDTIALEGHQCLVFFLGGQQTTAGGVPGCLGFADNPINPMAQGGTRIGPLYDFKPSRLTGAQGSFSYFDPYGTRPYAYFSHGKTLNNYNRYPSSSDCASLGVSPYMISVSNPVRYHAQDTFQIISAGADKNFGPGGLWSSAAAMSYAQPGKDDMTSFHPRLMGIQ